jgi:hypothetical protein
MTQTRYFTESGCEITRAVNAQPFEVQARGDFGRRPWRTIPGCYFATREEAMAKIVGVPNRRVIDFRRAS